jgi:hypothetical protein
MPSLPKQNIEKIGMNENGSTIFGTALILNIKYYEEHDI